MNFEEIIKIAEEETMAHHGLPKRREPPPLIERLKNEATEPSRVTGSQIYYYFGQSHLIGRGGSSFVFRGYYMEPEKKAAVKMIQCDEETDTNELEILETLRQSEQQTGSKFVVSLYASVIESNILYICMELAVCNLEEDLKFNFEFYPDYPRLAGYMKNIAAGLEFLHDINIIHRDIKPQNIFIFHQAQHKIAKLGDLGLGRELSDSKGSISFGKGTKMWMSPEALRALDDEEEFPNTKAVDIFSFGLVIVYSLCFQQHPCDVNGKLLVNIKNDKEVQFPAELYRFISAEHLAIWMLKKDPCKRPTISQCRAHPFLWENEEEKTLEFFDDVLNCVWNPFGDDTIFLNDLVLRTTIQDSIAKYYYLKNERSRISRKMGWSWKWTDELDPLVLESKSPNQTVKYNEYSVISYFKFIADKMQNPENMVEGVVSKLFSEEGSEQQFSRRKFAKYFANLYPELNLLLIFMLAKISPECKNGLEEKYLKEFVGYEKDWNCGKRMDEWMKIVLGYLEKGKSSYLRN